MDPSNDLAKGSYNAHKVHRTAHAPCHAACAAAVSQTGSARTPLVWGVVRWPHTSATPAML